MQFDWVTFGLQLVNVLVLLAILRHFLFRPVADIIAKRQAETQALLDQAEAAKTRAEAATRAAEAEADANAAARRQVLTEAQAEAGAERKRLLEAAQAEAQKLVDAARAQAAQTQADAEAASLTHAADLARTIATRALAGMPAPPTVAGFAARLSAALAALPDAERQALLSAPPLRLIAPQPLTEAELADVRAALNLPDLSAETDPALIAGLDLRSAAGVLHNSLAHDLTRIARAMEGAA